MKKLYPILLFAMLVVLVAPLHAQMQVEFLNRGAVAVREGNGYFLSWRLLGHEPFDTGFNIYRDGTRINPVPVTEVTSFLDPLAPVGAIYRVSAVINGIEGVPCRPARVVNNREGTGGWFDIPLNRPPTGARGGTYSPGDASVGDLDGDGELEIVLKWDPDNARDPAHNGHTDRVLLDAYTFDGQFLWRVDLGQNIRAGAHYTQFLVYDFDGDGRAELMVKTAPGTRDGTGSFISKGPAATANHTIDYTNAGGRVLDGPEFLTVFDGRNGAELATANYWPARGHLESWGDNWGNRADRFNAAVAYVDGARPSAIFQRGYYARMTFAAWDWRNGNLSLRWTFDSRVGADTIYNGQGSHSIHVIDANNDGLHDIVTGAAVIGANGRGIHTTRRGHGDAVHVTRMIPGNPRPVVFMPYEGGGHGVSLRFADNGQLLFNHRLNQDVGRGVAAELDISRPGFHFWASGGLGLYNLSGAVVGTVPNSINHVVWWDGDLARELLDQNRVDKWSIASNAATRLLTANGAASINGTKANPVLQADLFGDWREEIIFRRSDNMALRVYVTAMPTPHRLFTLMHDPVYRVAISWQNSTYNQPPHPGFYLASDMVFPQPAPVINPVRGLNRGSASIITNLVVEDIPNAHSWAVNDNLGTSTPVYGDMAFFVSPMPEFLAGAEWVTSAMASRRLFTRDVVARFVAGQDAMVYLLHSQRVTSKPAWLNGWVNTGQVVNVVNAHGTPSAMDLYSRQVNAGDPVTLGINSNDGTSSSLMYIVAAVPLVPSGMEQLHDQGLALEVFPNPFNTRANIIFNLDASLPVQLELFDINGRLVQVIANDIMTPGVKTFQLNSTGLARGVYILRLVAGQRAVMQKVVVR